MTNYKRRVLILLFSLVTPSFGDEIPPVIVNCGNSGCSSTSQAQTNIVDAGNFSNVLVNDGGLKAPVEINTNAAEIPRNLNLVVLTASPDGADLTVNLSSTKTGANAGNLVLISDVVNNLIVKLNGKNGTDGLDLSQVCAQKILSGTYGQTVKTAFTQRRQVQNPPPADRCDATDLASIGSFSCDSGLTLNTALDKTNPTVNVWRLEEHAKCITSFPVQHCSRHVSKMSCDMHIILSNLGVPSGGAGFPMEVSYQDGYRTHSAWSTGEYRDHDSLNPSIPEGTVTKEDMYPLWPDGPCITPTVGYVCPSGTIAVTQQTNNGPQTTCATFMQCPSPYVNQGDKCVYTFMNNGQPQTTEYFNTIQTQTPQVLAITGCAEASTNYVNPYEGNAGANACLDIFFRRVSPFGFTSISNLWGQDDLNCAWGGDCLLIYGAAGGIGQYHSRIDYRGYFYTRSATRTNYPQEDTLTYAFESCSDTVFVNRNSHSSAGTAVPWKFLGTIYESYTEFDMIDNSCSPSHLPVNPRDPNRLATYIFAGTVQDPSFSLEQISCAKDSCPKAQLNYSEAKVQVDSYSPTNGENATANGAGIIFAYEIKNPSIESHFGVPGKAGNIDLTIDESVNMCEAHRDGLTDGKNSTYARTPSVTVKKYFWQPVRVISAAQPGTNPTADVNVVSVYKKVDSSVRYLLQKNVGF